MSDFDNNMTGALFPNDRKSTDTQPNYTGKCEIEGRTLYISAWINTSKAGKSYLKLAFNEPMATVEATPGNASQGSSDEMGF